MSDYIISTNGELYHYGVPGMRWGHRKQQKYDKYQSNVSNQKTSFGRQLNAGKAAGISARIARKESIRNSTGIREKAHNAYGYTGASKMALAKSKSYSESAKRLEKRGDLKNAVKAKALSIHNKNTSNYYVSIVKSKNFIDRCAKENLRNYIDKNKYYTTAGREYTWKNETIKNILTMGMYSLDADRRYKKQYSAEERLARMS